MNLPFLGLSETQCERGMHRWDDAYRHCERCGFPAGEWRPNQVNAHPEIRLIFAELCIVAVSFTFFGAAVDGLVLRVAGVFGLVAAGAMLAVDRMHERWRRRVRNLKLGE